MARESISHHKAAEQIFDMIDTDGSGVLSTSELRKAFYNLRTGLDDDELMEVISLFDVGHTGRVEKSEFVHKLGQVFTEMGG